MCKKSFFAISLVAGILTFQGVLAAPSKVHVCHIPPNDPGNFHTITVSSNALNAHLGHGDLLGQCSEFAEQLCDDFDACTVDAFDPVTESCLNEHPPVDCNDSDLCTVDSCDPATGCQYALIVCDDGDACTADFCNAGECLAATIDCGELSLCDSELGCYDPCGGISCEPVDACHQPGECVFPGECIAGVPVPDETPCNDGNPDTIDDMCMQGVCEGAAACEPFEIVIQASTGQSSSTYNIVWYTTVPSTSFVIYVDTQGNAFSTSLDTALVTDHAVTLTGLRPFTIYTYIAESENSCGFVATSNEEIFRTNR